MREQLSQQQVCLRTPSPISCSLTHPPPKLTRPFTHTRPPKTTQVLPEAPRELVEELSRRYVYLYERITGQPFAPPALDEPVKQRMERNVAPYL